MAWDIHTITRQTIMATNSHRRRCKISATGCAGQRLSGICSQQALAVNCLACENGRLSGLSHRAGACQAGPHRKHVSVQCMQHRMYSGSEVNRCRLSALSAGFLVLAGLLSRAAHHVGRCQLRLHMRCGSDEVHPAQHGGLAGSLLLHWLWPQ